MCEASGVADATSYDFANDITLYAIWTARTLTLSYDSQGGSSVPSTTFVTGGSVSTAPADPTRSGYTFDGWFANASGGSRITFPYSPNATSNVTAYAQWTIVRTSGRGGGSPAPSTPVTPPSNNNGLGGTTDKDLKINPAKPIVATNPGKTEVTSKPENSTIKIAENKLPEVKGLDKAQIVNDEIVYTAKPGFSGVMQVPVEVTKNGVTEIITVPVTVNPAPVEAEKTPITKSKTVVKWEPSPNAVKYVVNYDGKTVCTTTTTTCAIPDLLGPKAKVDVTALGNDNTASTKTIPVYAPEKPVPVSAVNFAENSSKLDAAARAKLKKFAQLVIKQGFSTVVIEGHTDGQGGSKNAAALSLARANATAKFLRQFIKVEVVKNPKGEKQPIASNDTKFGQAKNRRATISVK